ncbi:hypothetical protein N7476_001808 [Penicillium atrosanguineum]|uniref:Azaphilone pigments biosynthesis cluster protein L N-terminal domain-containing protein n=1 Tax=Penicillium atrosanguineum TaxID=1132637 RepID=A0A9W9U823_9EURO|nr:hypothetical protein N7476_001808 [Penicillium atrosanguineum]
MTDPISLTTGLLALVTFTYGACQSILQEIQSFEGQPKDLWHLKGELESLKAILNSLLSVVSEPGADTDADLVSLKPPSLDVHSDGKKPSIRDWAMLKVRADQIKGARNILSVYRSTITLALANGTLRTSRVTQQVLDKYNLIIQDATSKLNAHIRQVDDRLNSLPLQKISNLNEKEELARLLREKSRVRQCLDICGQISQSINRGQSAIALDGASAACNTRHTSTETLDGNLTADETTVKFLNHFSLSTREACAKLELRSQFVQDKLKRFPANVIKEVDEVLTERCQRQNERDLLIGCLSVCEKATQRSEQARVNVFEDIHAAERAKQAVISDVGDLLSAKGIKADVDSEQILGQAAHSPFVTSQDRGIRRKSTERSSSGSKDMEELDQSRKFAYMGSSPVIYDLKNLLFVFLFVMLLRNV